MRITKIAMLVIALTLFCVTSKAQHRYLPHQMATIVVKPYVPSHISKHCRQKKRFVKAKKKPLHLAITDKKKVYMKNKHLTAYENKG